MKIIRSIGFIIGLLLSVTATAQDSDQNPNYKESQDKYTAKADDLNKTQGQTIQDTYEAFDWTEYKEEQKQNRKDRRYDKQKMRYQSHNHYNNNYNGYNNGSYYNNGNYNNNGYNNGYYNNGYNGNYNNSPNCNSTNGLYNSILLGSALYYLFN